MNPQKIIIYHLTTGSLMRALFLKRHKAKVYYQEVSSNLMKILLEFPLTGKILRTFIEPYKTPKYISEYEGSWFLIETKTVDLTNSFFDDQRIAEQRVVKVYLDFYRTERLNNAIKFLLQDKIREFLRFYYQVRCLSEDVVVHLPENILYRHILANDPFSNLRSPEVVFSGAKIFWVLSSCVKFCIYLLRVVGILLKRKINFNVQKKKYLVCQRSHHPKSEGLLRNDLLVDDKNIHRDEIVFFLETVKTEQGQLEEKYFLTNQYHYIVLEELSIPAGGLFHLLKDYVFLPIKAFFYSWGEKDRIVFESLLSFSKTALNFNFERLFYNLDMNFLMLFHSAGVEMVVLPILAAKYHVKIGIYNFGMTISWVQWAPYSFQMADYYFAWGDDVVQLYKENCQFLEVVKTGFFGKAEFIKINAKKDELKKQILGDKNQPTVITFYDLPYFAKRSSFPAKYLLKFYQAAIACSQIQGVAVVLKMKNKNNINKVRYPSEIQLEFDKLWLDVEAQENIIIQDTASYDPLHLVAISDINVTLELGSPGVIALLCGKLGLFYNIVYDYAHHPLYPKYFNNLIFSDTQKMMDAIQHYIHSGIDLRSILDDKDLVGYDFYRDDQGLTRFRQIVRRICDHEPLTSETLK